MKPFSLDAPTMIILLMAGNALVPILFLASRRDPATKRQCRLFLAGKWLQALAWLLIGLGSSLPALLASNLGATIGFCGYALEGAALAATGWADRRWGKTYGVLSAAIILLFWVIATTLSSQAGAAYAAMCALFLTAAASLFLSSSASGLKRLAGFMHLAVSGVFLAASLAAFSSGAASLIPESPRGSAVFLILFLELLAGATVFLLLLREETAGLLLESAAKFESLAEIAGESILVIQDKAVVHANEASSALFGQPLDAILGRPFAELSGRQESEEAARLLDALLAGGAPAGPLELRIARAPKEARRVMMSARLVSLKGRPALVAVLAETGEGGNLEERLKELSAELEEERNQAAQVPEADPLTRLSSRKAFDDRLVAEFYRLKRSGSFLSLVMIEVDRFGAYEEAKGKAEGDECLRKLASVLRGTVRRSADCAARFEGEDFAVLLPETDRKGAQVLAERIRKAVEELALPHPAGGMVTISLGTIIVLPSAMAVPQRAVELAGEALRKAREGGGNRAESSDPLIEETDIATGLVRLVWKPADSCGDPLIDSQHRALLDSMNRILGAIMERRGKDKTIVLFEDLMDQISAHFRDEEAIIRAASYPALERHCGIHAELLAKAREMVALYGEDRLGLGKLFAYIAYEVILKHMHLEDKDFFPYLPAPESR